MEEFNKNKTEYLSNEKNQIKEGKMFYFIMFFSFLYALHFLEQPSYISVGIIFLSLLLMLFENRYIGFSGEFVVLLITMLCYYCIFIYNGAALNFYNVITYFIAPVGFYFIAYNLVDNVKDLKMWMYSFVSGFFIFGCLNLLNTKTGVNWYDVDVINIWSGNLISETLMGPLFSLASSLSFYLIFVNKKIYIKVLGIITFTMSILCSLKIANRTLLAVTILMFVISCIIYLILSKSFKKNIKIILLISTLFIVLLSIFYSNVGGVQDIIEGSNLYRRIFGGDISVDSVLDTPRYATWTEMLIQFFDYFLGGRKAYLSGGFVHNLWLDVCYQTGWIVALLMISYTLINLCNVIKFARQKEVDVNTKLIVIVISITAFINFFLEPVLEGMPLYFIVMCAFNGMINKLNNMSY